ncbi:hypothetical protein QA584_16160 [Anaerocolumna sp. AGMB13025]|uniref:hypothetical protein n=1 Tax=Anaerocolumna sp. AGMB13025 TaxID=3039116 RepID=UPI00241EEA83|nr:hypothetical protein [Anaerocolumna sp. AGMB13025]WFR55140.1 hypothetical protein QA584_16160 [Anaerocolumna sp. AGMB13025]
MDYTFGFSIKGLIIFLLPMIPNLFFFLFPKNGNAFGNADNKHVILDILEHGSQAVFVFLLIFLINRQTSLVLGPYTFSFGIALIMYFILWGFYFSGNNTLFILLGLAIIPVVYFILSEIWLHNLPAIIPTMIFGIVHTIITYIDWKKIQ